MTTSTDGNPTVGQMDDKNIVIRQILTLRGPNIWTYRPVLEAWVDIGELEDFPSNKIPGLYERLSTWIPSLIEHRCSYEERGGFLRRVEEGTWPGHILEHLTLELQNLAGLPGGFGKARETSERGVYKVVVRAWHEDVTRAALYAARDLLMAAIQNRPFDVRGAVERLRTMTDRMCLGPSTASIVDGADDRDIPAIRLTDGNLVQLGYGSAARRIWTAETDTTSAIGETISRDKDLTKQLLASVGVPVPEGRIVDSPADAWDAAQSIGLPAVVKPCDANHGRGVFINLNHQAEVEAAYAVAVEEGSGVIVERFIPGNEHRLLVVGGKVVAAARGEPVWVIGDGIHAIEDLVELQINTDPRRGHTEDHPLNPVRMDSSACVEIAKQGFEPSSVPPAGTKILIQRNGNVAFDVTDLVHPSVAAAAGLAARTVGLDIAGVDLVVEDIAQPLQSQGGAIVEVNAGPGLLMHLKPAEGQPRRVGHAIVDHLFPATATGRVPLVGVTGTNGKTTVAKIVAKLLRLADYEVGLACSTGLYSNDRSLQVNDAANWASAQKLLLNRDLEAIVIENGTTSILGEGLAYDRCQVGIVTNLGHADKLGEYAIETREKMYNVLRTQIDVVLPNGFGILNAGDALVAEMAELCDGEVIFFAADPQQSDCAAVLTQHHNASASARSVQVRDGEIVLVAGSNATRLCRLSDVPLTRGGRSVAQIENVLAAVAAGWALGLTKALLLAGIETFDLHQDEAAGAFEVFQHHGAEVILDGAHNVDALQTLSQSLAAQRHTTLMWQAGGARSAATYEQMAALVSTLCDRVIFLESSEESQGAQIMARALANLRGRCSTIVFAQSFEQALDDALTELETDHVLIVKTGELAQANVRDRVRAWCRRA